MLVRKEEAPRPLRYVCIVGSLKYRVNNTRTYLIHIDTNISLLRYWSFMSVCLRITFSVWALLLGNVTLFKTESTGAAVAQDMITARAL